MPPQEGRAENMSGVAAKWAGASAPLTHTLRPDLDRDQMVCPECGDGYVHFSLGHVERTDDYTCPLGTRGSWVALDFWCENGEHRWRLVVGEHKGFTYLGNVTR